MTGMAAATSPVVDPIEPSTVDPIVDPAVVEPTPDANAAESSPVDTPDANAPKDLLSVVKAAVEKPEPLEDSSTPKDDPAEPEAEAAAAADPAQAEDDANLPFHNHPRWQAVIAERDSLKDPAERYGLITGFMQEHGLSNEEVAEGYEVMALLKSGDPAKLTQAREWFSDRLDALDGMLGLTLPSDLQERIESGLLDEAGALEIAQSRATVALRENQITQRTERETAESAERDAAAVTGAMVTAVEAWETRIKAADPDYSKKADLIQAKCGAIVQQTGKAPRTAAEATALADQAYAEVNALLKSGLPKPRPITPAPTGQSTTVTTQPTSLRAAIDQAVGR